MSTDDKPPQAPAGLLQNGMAVYFEECKRSPHRKSLKLKFRGHGFGILLGVLPHFKKEVTRSQLVALMGGVGFVLLDDVADFLGDEAAATFTEKFHAKYDEGPPNAEPETPRIVGLDGLPREPEIAPLPVAGNPSDSEIAGNRE